MQFPIVNKTAKEVLINLEPEGHTLPLAPGKELVVTYERGDKAPQLEIEIEEEFITIAMMCGKEVWCDGELLKR